MITGWISFAFVDVGIPLAKPLLPPSAILPGGFRAGTLSIPCQGEAILFRAIEKAGSCGLQETNK
jgi:hypothetical protein